MSKFYWHIWLSQIYLQRDCFQINILHKYNLKF